MEETATVDARETSSNGAGAESPGEAPSFAGPWFMSPFFERMLEQCPLDPEAERQVRSYAEQGFMIVDDIGLGDPERLAERLVAEVGPLHRDGDFNRVAEAWTASEAAHAIATAPKLLEIVRMLYRRDPIPFQTINFWRGSEQATHSDAMHFSCIPRDMMCGLWVALEDTDETNGALHYYPGSHRLPHIEYADLGLAPGKDFYPHYAAYVREMVAEQGLRKQTPSLRRGQALIWAANLLHGGDPVADPSRTRVSQVTHCYFDNCSYYTPLRSDLARGKIFFRQITDLRTGRLKPARIDGRRIPVPLLSRLVTWRRVLGRRIGRGVERHPA